MLFVHETHQVVGLKEDEFETLYRTGWMPMLAEGDDARLLWYMNHAHGSGPAYNVVTITGVRDGAAWEKPPLRWSVHCIGVRTARRPGMSRFSPMPISSP